MVDIQSAAAEIRRGKKRQKKKERKKETTGQKYNDPAIISPVRDSRSTPLEWLSSRRDLDLVSASAGIADCGKEKSKICKANMFKYTNQKQTLIIPKILHALESQIIFREAGIP